VTYQRSNGLKLKVKGTFGIRPYLEDFITCFLVKSVS